MAKLFVFTVSLDEGVSEIWHFKANDTLSVTQYILDNPKTYDKLLDYLPVGKKANELTAATLLRLIEESSIDGDSAYGFQIFEMDTSDIVEVPDSTVEKIESINPNFISDEQLKSLATVKKFYRSEDVAFNNLFKSNIPLTDVENDFIKKMSEHQRSSRAYSEMRDEKSIFNFIAPLIFQINQSSENNFNLNETTHNYPIQTIINNNLIKTQLDWIIYTGYDSDPQPLFILEANWKRPSSIRDDQVILAKLIATLHQFPKIETLYGGYFWGSSSFHFCQLTRKQANTFEFHTNNGFTTYHQLSEIYKVLKYFLHLNSKNSL